MQDAAEQAYLELRNQATGPVYRNICDSRIKVGIAKILWDFQIQTNKMVVADHHGGRQAEKKAVVVDVAIPSDSNIKKNEYEKL